MGQQIDPGHGEGLVPTDAETGQCSWIGGSVRSPVPPAAASAEAHNGFHLLADGWDPKAFVNMTDRVTDSGMKGTLVKIGYNET